jgi:hypothetical protein
VIGLGIKIDVVTGGHHIQFIPLPKIELALRYGFGVWFVLNFSNIFLKMALDLMLLRFKTERWWRILLWGLIAINSAMGVVIIVIAFTQCQPLTAFWTISQRFTHCWSGQTVVYISYIWNCKSVEDTLGK